MSWLWAMAGVRAWMYLEKGLIPVNSWSQSSAKIGNVMSAFSQTAEGNSYLIPKAA
jgi:hypothetical protein